MNIIYLKIDLSISVSLKAIEEYLILRNVSDLSAIFDNYQSKYGDFI